MNKGLVLVDAPVLKECGEWIVSLAPQHDAVFPWRATGTRGLHADWFEGSDPEHALSGFARLAGLDRRELLDKFGIGS